MSNTIDYQLSVAYQINEHQLNEQQKSQKWAEARIAQSHHTAKKLAVGKDIVLPSNPDDENSAKGKGTAGSQKPSLPTPSKGGWDSLNGGQNIPLIAIIGKVLALQAKTNSNFWSSLWKMGTQSMKIQVSFAPIIGKAVKGQWNEQASATRAEAKMAYNDAWANLVGFVLTVALGGAMAVGGGEETPPDDPKVPPSFQTEDGEGSATNSVNDDSDSEDEAPASGPANTTPNSPGNSELNTEDENAAINRSNTAQSNNDDSARAENKVNDDSDSKTQRANRTKENVKSRLQRGLKGVNTFMQKAMGVAGLTDMATRTYTGFNDAHYKGKSADHTEKAGQNAARSQVAEQYAQYYGQSFNRTEEIRQGAQQNIDYAMNILKSVVDQITSTVASMFRG